MVLCVRERARARARERETERQSASERKRASVCLFMSEGTWNDNELLATCDILSSHKPSSSRSIVVGQRHSFVHQTARVFVEMCAPSHDPPHKQTGLEGYVRIADDYIPTSQETKALYVSSSLSFASFVNIKVRRAQML